MYILKKHSKVILLSTLMSSSIFAVPAFATTQSFEPFTIAFGGDPKDYNDSSSDQPLESPRTDDSTVPLPAHNTDKSYYHKPITKDPIRVEPYKKTYSKTHKDTQIHHDHKAIDHDFKLHNVEKPDVVVKPSLDYSIDPRTIPQSPSTSPNAVPEPSETTAPHKSGSSSTTIPGSLLHDPLYDDSKKSSLDTSPSTSDVTVPKVGEPTSIDTTTITTPKTILTPEIDADKKSAKEKLHDTVDTQRASKTGEVKKTTTTTTTTVTP